MNRRALHYIVVMAALLVLHAGSVHSQLQKKYWVFFADKGEGRSSSGTLALHSSAYQDALKLLQPRALARRGKMLPADALVDAADLPLYQPYIEAVEKTGGVFVHQSRWLNAASYTLRPGLISAIRSLPFVIKVQPVAGVRQTPFELSLRTQSTISNQTFSYNYGLSLQQDTSVDIPVLHNMGITGKKVLVGLLDSGFRWKMHEALRTRHVVAEYDFVFHDSITANQAADSPDQDFHGTLVMSVLGGYMPGQLIGPAFDADFILGKTEYVPTETRQEEDNWAAGIEWMESYGVDVVSSSVGYNTFDPPDSGYSWLDNDFNGRTSITAQAAERACKLGVVVCNAMGNEGNNNSGIGTLLTPADTDTLISVGAVSFSRQLASFSSQGPTSDGRIKPDVVAAGINVYGALTPGPNTYGTESGTSLSTPLVAGSAALMLSVRPELTPLQVRNAFRSTAIPITNPSRFPLIPNNFTGWGLIDAFHAALSFGPIFSNRPVIDVDGLHSVISTVVISKFGIKPASVIFHYAPDSSNSFLSVPMTLDSEMFYRTSGRYRVVVPNLPYNTPVRFTIGVQDSAGNTYASPAPLFDTSWFFHYGVPDNPTGHPVPATVALEQNYPNPFTGFTVIGYDLPQRDHVRIVVFDELGRTVATLVDDVENAGDASSRKPLVFYANSLASGVYFYRMTTSSFTETKKMMLVNKITPLR